MKGAFFCFLSLIILTNFSTQSLFAKNKANPKIDKTQSIIENAQDLLLENKRNEAQDLLISALEEERLKPTNGGKLKSQKLLKSLNNLSEMFLSDQTQQLFESGSSIKKNNPQISIQTLQEALRSEPQNVKIISELSNVYLKAGDCLKANEVLRPEGTKLELLKIDYIESLSVIYAEILLCQKKMKEYNEFQNKRKERFKKK